MGRLGMIFATLCVLSAPVFGQKTLSDGIKDLATQISASTTKEQKHRVAVLPFKELDGQTTVLGTYLAEELVTHLVNSGLKVVERGLLDKLLGEQKLQQSGAIDPETAKQVGKVAGVEAIVTGSVTDLQSNVGINCRLIDTTTGEIFAAAQTKITKDDDVKKIQAVVVQTPTTALRSTSASVLTKAAPELTFTRGPVRYSIDGLHGTGKSLTTTIVVENTSGEGQHVYVGTYWLIDENGDRWKGKTPDGSEYLSLQVPSGTRRRFRWIFEAEGGATGNVFTLTDGDNRESYLRNLPRLP